MRARKFDTLQYANTLKDAGIESKAAEAIARGQAEANEDVMANLPGYCDLVTRTDLKAELVNFATKNDLLQVESKLELKIVELHADLERQVADVRSDIRNVETSLNGKIGEVLVLMKGTEDRLVGKINNLTSWLLIKLSAVLVIIISAAGGLNHFFHIFS